MKLSKLILTGLAFCLCVLALSSCKKKWERFNKGEATALKNGVEWQSHVKGYALSGHLDGALRLNLPVYDNNGYEIERMSFLLRPWDPGTYNLIRFDPKAGHQPPYGSYATSMQHGHLTCDYYYLDTTAAKNYLTITSYNPKSGKIEGEFELSVEIDPPKLGPSPQEPKCDPAAPDHITFTKGKFWGYVEE